MRRLLPIALAVLITAPSAALGAAVYDCAMTGAVGSSCCCEAPEDSAPEGPSIAGRCCTLLPTPAVLAAPALLEASRGDLAPATALVSTAVAGAPFRTGCTARPLRSGIQASRMPVYLRVCSWLI